MDTIVELFQQHSRRLATATSVLMVILMSLSIARTTLFLIEQMGTTPTAPAAAVQTPGAGEPAADTVDLASLDLFGRVQAEAQPEVVDAPETRLNLELQGVFTAEDRDNSTAIVAEGNKDGELYHIGDRLPGNAVLTDVFDDYILIKRGSRVEKLMFDDSALRQQGQSARTTASHNGNLASSTRSRLDAIRQRIADRTRNGNTASAKPSPSPGQSIRDYVEHYRDKIRNDPQSVLDELGVSTVQAGEAKGYRVGGNVSQQALLRAGLQKDDVILSVNGQPVGNIANDRSLVDQALQAGRVRVEVKRGDRRFFLTVPIPGG